MRTGIVVAGLAVVIGAAALGFTLWNSNGQQTAQANDQAGVVESAQPEALILEPTKAPLDKRFRADAQSIADAFAQWDAAHNPSFDGRTDESSPQFKLPPHLMAHVGGEPVGLRVMKRAPFEGLTMCRMPLPEEMNPALLESAADTGEHGRKLYFSYQRWGLWHSRTDQIVVPSDRVTFAESPAPKDATAPRDTRLQPKALDAVGQVSVKWSFKRALDSRGVRLGERAGVFMMFRVDASTPGTDDGWVYATTDSKYKVTSVGQMSGCMGCHTGAKGESRLLSPAN